MTQSSAAETPPIIIKKYANRRLYNTSSSSYVTLDDLSAMIKQGGEFVVYDAKTGEDITRSVLTQIIVEEEQKGENLLPISFLRQIIGLYGGNMQWLVPRYLEHAMKSFAHNQDQMRKAMQDAFGGLFPFGGLEEVGKQNMALFEKTMKMFSPFPGAPQGQPSPPGPNATQGPASTPSPEAQAGEAGQKQTTSAEDAGLRELNERLNTLQKQIESLSGKATAAKPPAPRTAESGKEER